MSTNISMWKAVIECRLYNACLVMEKLGGIEDLLDEDGYPTSETLQVIESWNWTYSYEKLFDYIGRAWQFKEFGWHDGRFEDRIEFRLSTAGWSGNESIIRALEANTFHVWDFVWVQSRRGGHYIFEVKLED